MNIEINHTTGNHDGREYLEHSLTMGDFTTGITRVYFEEVDKLILRNMPMNMLEQLLQTVELEMLRRLNNEEV